MTIEPVTRRASDVGHTATGRLFFVTRITGVLFNSSLLAWQMPGGSSLSIISSWWTAGESGLLIRPLVTQAVVWHWQMTNLLGNEHG